MPAQEIPVNLFQCLEAEVDQPVDEALVPVTSIKTEIARTVFYELMSGPLPCEWNNTRLGRCFVKHHPRRYLYYSRYLCLHLASELDFNAREEKLLYYSLVYSLCDLSNLLILSGCS